MTKGFLVFFTRRSILKAVLAALPAHCAARDLGQLASPAQGTVPVDGARAFLADQVRLLPGSPFYVRQELHRNGVLASYDPDKLLYPYRALAKLPQKEGVESGYDGWDNGFLRGHMAGHYLSAAARMAVATDSRLFRDRVNYLVGELAACQRSLNLDGYLAAFSTAAFDQLEGKPGADAGGIGAPYYTIQKIMSGLLDAHAYVGNKQALVVVTRMADYFGKRLAALDAAQIDRMFRTDGNRNPPNEFGAMSDVLTELFKIGKDPRHLAAARLFNRAWFVGPLAEGEDRLGSLHANTHIAQAVGLANYANAHGNPEALKASENFWRLVVHRHSFANGGNSFNEWFDQPGTEAGPSIDDRKVLPPTTGETCNTHNMLKLTARLFERNRRAELADYYERALYNHVLASVAPDSGAVTYFTPLHGDFRTYLNGSFCCSGSGIENTARYNEGIYFHKDASLWVNLYIPSELSWREAGMLLRQQGDITRGDAVRLSVVKAGASAVTLNLRIPAWVAKPVTVRINDKPQGVDAKPASYLSFRRQWKAGDVIELTLPAGLRLEQARDVSSMVAIFHGPVLLAGELGKDNMPASDVGDKDAFLKVAAAPVPDIVSASGNPADWLAPLPGDPSAFRIKDAGPANGIVVRPLFDLHHQRYSVYWRLRKDT
ncbi:beta-L-arabinofuranosidase domain-containing protein [Pseudoduganella rivuli]|uniref:beta-L-arabinofuranosidase domain-containing protein n=1 Tax=Pseudoduganella rivuli TaxID=2666085 RepID=UPI0018A23555|nr:beta-L-arabinofuranosidase domain-containing protein [Pseudoduganella rivuli]